MNTPDMNYDEICIHPIGTVCNDLQYPPLVADEKGLTHNHTCHSPIMEMATRQDRRSEIVIREDLAELLDGLEGFSHVIMVYWGDRISDDGRRLHKVHPAGMTQFPVQGIFATCSPARPNPILITVVRLHTRDKNRLFVSGLDAVDKSPVLDIKPFVPAQMPQEDVTIPEWMRMVMEEFRH